MVRSKPKTKRDIICRQMAARNGASIQQLCAATSWQSHSVRAAISGLRKAGYSIERKPAKTAESGAIYRIGAEPGGA